MKITSVLCQRCGAPLDIPDQNVRFVTCGHCATPLEIVREATHSHSRIMQEIHAATTESAKTLKVIELQNDLEHLDRQWETAQKEICGQNSKTGVTNDTPAPGLMGFGILLLCASGFAIKELFDPHGKDKVMIAVAAAVLVGLGVFAIRTALQQQAGFAKMREHYLAARSSIIQRIRGLRKR